MKKYDVTTAEAPETLPCTSLAATYWRDDNGTRYAACAEGHNFEQVAQQWGTFWKTYTNTLADEMDDMVNGPAIWYRAAQFGGGNGDYIPVVVLRWYQTKKAQAARLWMIVRSADGVEHRVRPHNVYTPKQARRYCSPETIDAAVILASGAKESAR